MNKPKRIPYALTNFYKIRTENYLYVDKTRFIEMLENEDTEYHFLLRPRKFGKSLFLSVLEHYYDIRFKDKFEELFGDLYIGQNPTPKRNSYFVLNIDFSGLNTGSVEEFKVSFSNNIEACIIDFFIRYDYLVDADFQKKLELQFIDESGKIGVDAIKKHIFNFVQKNKGKLYVIIDEYDHFANDIIAKGTQMSKNQYQESIWANSITKDFYETLKNGAKSVIDKIFITGITPIMLDDLTSGFNISNNLSVDVRYNEVLGLTREEVEWVMEQVCLDKSQISLDIEKMYDGYLFHEKGNNKLFNSTMIFNYLRGFLNEGNDFKYIVDDNLKTDYGRIRNLVDKFKNKTKLRKLVENNSVGGNVIKQFSIEKIHEDKNFFSLLYYMGLITIDNSDNTSQRLTIPNYSVKTIFWDFIENMLTEEIEGLSLDNSQYEDPVNSLAYKNSYELFFEYFSKNIVKYLSNRDLQETVEKDIKFLLLPLFFTSNYYLPISELENSEGYTDIYLQRSHLHPNTISEWLWEIKYIKQKDAKKKSLIDAKKKEAIERLQAYKTSNLFKHRTDVRFLAVVFTGKNEWFVEEV